jgi:pilus assembly protein CpaC
MRVTDPFLCAVLFGSSVLLPASASASAPASAIASLASPMRTGTLEVPVNKSDVLRTDRPFARALIGNADIADVLPLSDRSVYLLGKKTGATTLTLYDRSSNLIGVVDVTVGPDVIGLRGQLANLFPQSRIDATLSNDSIVLRGVLDSSVAVDRAILLASTYAPQKVVNMLAVGSAQQVMLEVRFSEMKRSVARQIGVNNAFHSNSGNFLGATGSTAPTTAILTDQNGHPTVDLTALASSFGIFAGMTHIGNVQIEGVLDALENKGLITTLAEPNLVALSGQTASFLAGGEFPIPVAQSATVGSGGGNNNGTAITVEFKPFGVSLAFTPTVLEDGVINLLVEPEVSSIDPSASVSISGLVIPGLQTRRAKTTLELHDGQSFAIAGLLRKNFQDTIKQFPVLGSIPIIGALFRSSGFQREDTELVIVVTPHLVRPTAPDRSAADRSGAEPARAGNVHERKDRHRDPRSGAARPLVEHAGNAARHPIDLNAVGGKAKRRCQGRSRWRIWSYLLREDDDAQGLDIGDGHDAVAELRAV